MTWELGSGWGHVVPALPIIECVRSRGHQVIFAIPNLALAQLAESKGANCILCPSSVGRQANEICPTENLAQVLFNSGFGDREALSRLVREWIGLFEEVRPDFVLCDHSPRALLAMRATRARATVAAKAIGLATMGIGFCCPPASAFDSLLLEGRPVPDRADEMRVLAISNSVLAEHNSRPLARMAELFEEVDETFLMTYAELDHFPVRSAAKYFGSMSMRLGEAVEWPESTYRKVFIYTRRFPALEELLKYISRSELSALVYCDDTIPGVQEVPGRGRIRYLDQRFDLEHVAATCDLAITNGNHGTTSAMLLAGKPVLVIPTVTEQYMNGRRLEELGAGQMARPDELDAVIRGLRTLLRDESIRECARLFRAKYAGHKSERVIEEIVSRIQRRV